MDIGVRSEKTYFRMVALYESREVAIVRTMKAPLREDSYRTLHFHGSSPLTLCTLNIRDHSIVFVFIYKLNKLYLITCCPSSSQIAVVHENTVPRVKYHIRHNEQTSAEPNSSCFRDENNTEQRYYNNRIKPPSIMTTQSEIPKRQITETKSVMGTWT